MLTGQKISETKPSNQLLPVQPQERDGYSETATANQVGLTVSSGSSAEHLYSNEVHLFQKLISKEKLLQMKTPAIATQSLWPDKNKTSVR